MHRGLNLYIQVPLQTYLCDIYEIQQFSYHQLDVQEVTIIEVFVPRVYSASLVFTFSRRSFRLVEVLVVEDSCFIHTVHTPFSNILLLISVFYNLLEISISVCLISHHLNQSRKINLLSDDPSGNCSHSVACPSTDWHLALMWKTKPDGF